jgi:hypothetical protein
VLTLFVHSTYSQYPIIKKVKGDSVVIMTVGQANDINLLYKSYNDTIFAYKDSLSFKNNQYVSAIAKIRSKEDSIGLYKFHIQNIKPIKTLDEEFKEKWQRAQELNRLWIFILFMGLALIKTQ